ncbi:MAG: rRNA maturation RNase YbeY [Muribaculaceae bacterium]
MSIGQKNSLTPRISWQAQNVEMPELDQQRLALWLQKVTEAHSRILDGLGYIFCDDETILDVNRQFLSHDYYTDIITFDYCRGRMVRGDMYISLDTVATNAEAVGEPYVRELLRVIVHGVLHLCGINDKGPGEREIMEAHENAALEMWDSMTA